MKSLTRRRCQMDKWISVKDQMPERGDDVLIFDGKTVAVAQLFRTIKGMTEWERPSFIGGWDSEIEIDETGVSHWMPLPEPPL